MLLPKTAREETAKEGASIVYTDDSSLQGRAGDFACGISEAHAMNEFWRDGDGSCDALTHALVGNSKGGDGDDELEQLVTRESLPELLFVRFGHIVLLAMTEAEHG